MARGRGEAGGVGRGSMSHDITGGHASKTMGDMLEGGCCRLSYFHVVGGGVGRVEVSSRTVSERVDLSAEAPLVGISFSP